MLDKREDNPNQNPPPSPNRAQSALNNKRGNSIYDIFTLIIAVFVNTFYKHHTTRTVYKIQKMFFLKLSLCNLAKCVIQFSIITNVSTNTLKISSRNDGFNRCFSPVISANL